MFPPRCAYCDADLSTHNDELLLCGDCCQALAAVDWAACQRCGAAAPADHSSPASCPQCQAPPLHFDTVVPLGAYRDQLREAVLRMKHPTGEPLSTAMATLYWQRRGENLAALRPDIVIPMPMHWARRLVRGTNSPDVLAACLARHLRVPMVRQVLLRGRKTLPQASLPRKKRFQNVSGAFRLRRGYDLRGVRVILADDILSTGATCSEAARVLKQAGASTVGVAVLARAEGGHLW